MQPTGIYRFTSIARPVDPAFATNRAVLFIVPIAAALAAVFAWLAMSSAEPLGMAVSAALGTFGAWALARELAPDDDPAAFVAMALAFGAIVVGGPVSALPLFATLFLVRIVNRTTGLDARWTDSLLITGFVVWAMGAVGDPLLGIAASIAFYLDASLARPARMQLAFGSFCLAASMFYVVRDGVGMPAMVELAGPAFWVTCVVLFAYSIVLSTVRKLQSHGDVSGEPLNTPRVRGGMFVAGLVAAQSPVISGETAINPLIWAAMAGIVIGAVASLSSRLRAGAA